MVNFALIGCGRIAARHAELLAGGQVTDGRLAAVCDIVKERAVALGEKYGVPSFTDMDEMLQQVDSIDAVSILTPSGYHSEHALRIAPYKKHIVVEKPLALSIEGIDQMIKACDDYGIKLFVVQQNRFNRPVMLLREAIEQKRFGKLVLGTVRVRWSRTQEYYDQDEWRGTWALDGGVLTNQASHHIDLLQWMMGDVESVFARSTTALVDIEAEDTAIATLKFKSGALGIIEATTAIRPADLEGSLSILGEKGSVVIGGFAVNKLETWQFVDNNSKNSVNQEDYSENPPGVYGYGHRAYYNHVVECIVKKQTALVEGIDGRKSLELIMALYESIETGREVFLQFKPKKCRLGAR